MQDCWFARRKNVVGCKWMFTFKFKSNGDIERYNARLVAKAAKRVYLDIWN